MKSRLKMSYHSGNQQAAMAAAAAASQAHHQQVSAAAAAAAAAQAHHQSQQQQATHNQQYCLKWNNHTNNMVRVFNELLSDESFVDVTLSCEGVSVKAHKLVLSACSTYFRDLFINNPCKHPIVILNNIRYEDLQLIIKFMYSGEANVKKSQIGPLLKTAETLKVKGLTDVNEKHGDSFFGLNGISRMDAAMMNGSDAGSLYNSRMSDLDGSVIGAGSPFGAASPGSPVPSAGNDTINHYHAYMAQQRMRKRKRKHHNNGSAMALANVLGQNGNGSSFAAMAAMANSNGMNGNGVRSQNGVSPIKKMLTNDPDDNNESGDEVNSAKRVKDSNSSNDDSTVNHDDPKSPSSSYNNSSNNSNNNTHMDENEMMAAMAMQMARSQNGMNGPTDHDEDDEDRDDGTMNGDGDHTDGQMPNDSMMMGDSDDDFYTDVKPIVSLDESPSPTPSNMDDSVYSNSFGGSNILENSLAGISPGSQMPNSTKMCVCHLCHLTFTAYSSLRRHMTRHYADRERYECDICLKSYSRKDYLKEHKKLKHSSAAQVMNSQKSAKAAAAAAAAAAASSA